MPDRWLTAEQVAAHQERMRAMRIGGAAASGSEGEGHAPTTADRPAKPTGPLEADILAAVLECLLLHPRVAWRERMNSGGFYDQKGQYVRFGFKGCSDIIGQLKDGRFLAVECKRDGAQPTPEQRAFLDSVNAAGGLAFVARSVDDVMRELS